MNTPPNMPYPETVLTESVAQELSLKERWNPTFSTADHHCSQAFPSMTGTSIPIPSQICVLVRIMQLYGEFGVKADLERMLCMLSDLLWISTQRKLVRK